MTKWKYGVCTAETTAKTITERVIKELNDRKGFDDWWDGVGEEIREDIKAELYSIAFGEIIEMEE